MALGTEEADSLLDGMPQEERMASWHLVEAKGVHSGGAGFPPVFARLPGGPAARPLASDHFPGATDRVYRWVADHRSLLGRPLPASARQWADGVISGSRPQRPMNTGMAIDPLIDLPTADDFHALLAREELRRARTGETLTVAMLDVDGLRWVNAHHGAGTGSDILRLCVSTLRSNLRAVDELAGMGPDEFGVLLHATDSRNARSGRTASRTTEGPLLRDGSGPGHVLRGTRGHLERDHRDGGRHSVPTAAWRSSRRCASCAAPTAANARPGLKRRGCAGLA